MKRFKGLLAVGGLVLMACASYGQSGHFDPTPHGFSFRGGIVMPGTDPLRAMENNWLSIGLDYTFDKQFVKGSETYMSVDWIGKSGSGEHGTFWPILISQKFYTQRDNTENRTYYTVGIGVVVFNVFSSDTVLGGKFGAGFELSPQLFLEGNYYLSDASKGNVRANSFGMYIGYRF